MIKKFCLGAIIFLILGIFYVTAFNAVNPGVNYCEMGYTECSDGIDNDGDGQVDYPNDIECRSYYDTNEETDPQCANGEDDDYDSEGVIGDSTYSIDYPYDSDCSSPEDNFEGLDTGSAAAEYEKGFFSILWDWLTFWE